MIRFLDGPAAGKALLLRRAPLFLRLTVASDKLDALDQLDDEPAPGEALFAYRRVGAAGWVHIDFARGKGRNRSAWYAVGEYALVAEQPPDEVLRSREDWRAWCIQQQKGAAS